MLKQKSIYLDYIKEVKELVGKNFISINSISELEREIEDTELIIPVVGGFSAGKSTLINSFLDSTILPTNLTPETALATELRYSKQNFIEAIKDDGSCDRYEINQLESIKEVANRYKFLKLYLNNKKLKEIEPLVLVDMPGFDSPLALHNKAILNYLQKGIYFVVLVSVEDGGVPNSILCELENMSEFNKGFSFCLSKTNLKPQDDVFKIRDTINEQLNDELDFEKDIILLDDNGGSNLEIILKDIDSEKLFYSLFIDRLKDSYFYIDSEISTKISTLKKTKEESLEAIISLKDGIQKIISKKEKLISEIKERYSDKSSESIVEAVANELLKNQEHLISIALQNKELFQQEINTIVKNRLIYELNTKMDSIGTNIIDDFSYELKSLDTGFDDFAINDKWIETISNGTKTLLQSTQSGLDKISQHTKGKEGTIYKVIATTVGLTTTVLNPILEIVVIFLPDIIGFFSAKSQENKQKEMIKSKFNAEIIPSLKIKLREVVQTTMYEQINKLINDISEQFEAKIIQKEQEIQQTLQEKEQNIEQSEEEIKALQEIQTTLQTLTTQKLLQKD